jgi:sugar lactone lactonase YvrE
MKNIFYTFLFISSLTIGQKTKKIVMSEFAQSKFQWTGIAISKKNRVFVNFPRWTTKTPIAVAEIVKNKTTPFPDTSWNNILSEKHFVCVQSIFVDENDRLWVLDTGYELEKDSTNGATLYCFDLKTKFLLNEYFFPASLITSQSYLNDFRVDLKNQTVYLTDSRVGGIVVLNLVNKQIRRILANHPSTLTEVKQIVVEGKVRTHPVHSDGIELNQKSGHLYYCSLMGKNVYKISTDRILDPSISEEKLGSFVENYATTGANDGIILDKKGNLYLSSLEKNAISVLTNKKELKEVITDNRIKWPDSFAFDCNGNLYFTISQIHLPEEQRGMYKIFKLKL